MKFSKHISNFNVKKIEMLSKKGYNISEISDIINIPNRRLGEMLKYFNISINTARYIKNVKHDYFKIIDTEAKAYILGFLIADGSVLIEPKKKNGKIYSYSKRISFCNSIDDLEIIEFIKNQISPSAKLKFIQNNKGSKNRKKQVNLRINSSTIVDSLINLNIKPRKTYDINFEFNFNNIPNKLIHHFIRGFFDGDGWITKNLYKSVGFVGTSIYFMQQLRVILEQKLNYNFNIIPYQNKNMITYSLTFYLGKNTSSFYNYLYKDANIYLNRKKVKFIDNTVLTN